MKGVVEERPFREGTTWDQALKQDCARVSGGQWAGEFGWRIHVRPESRGSWMLAQKVWIFLIKGYKNALKTIKLYFLLGWHWFPKPYWFQLYNSIKHCLHTALCAHHPSKVSFCSHFPPPFDHFHLPHSPFPLAITTQQSVWLCYIYDFCLISSHTFI